MALTIRERILQEWASRLAAMDTGSYSIQWTNVVRTPLDRVDKIFDNVVSLFDISEQYTGQIRVGVDEPILTVLVEFWIKSALGVDISSRLNEVLGDLKTLFKSDPYTQETGTGVSLSLNIEIARIDFDIDGPRDDLVGGYLELRILYRHKPTDPTAIM